MRVGASVPLLLLELAGIVTAISLDCHKIVADGQKWDLSSLEGPREVHERSRLDSEGKVGAVLNTTFTFDVCKALKETNCQTGTRICADIREYDKDTKETPKPIESFAIAGEGTHNHGRPLDPIPTRLKSSESGTDSEKEGVRISFSGGMHSIVGQGDVKQKALVDFVCDRKWTGQEKGKGCGSSSSTDSACARSVRSRAEEGDDDELPPLDDLDEGSALRLVSYKTIEDTKDGRVGVLRLEWKTKMACEDALSGGGGGGSDQDGRKTSGWGFFTWLIIVVFLATAAYLIFGSWLNYTRYGARGWDLLPHGDTVRDVPYLLKDWARRVFSGGVSLGSGGSRGGYTSI